MATYKVSYKMLAKQGEDLKAVAKTITTYSDKLNQVRGKLGGDEMLAKVRSDLQKLATQLGELRTVLNMAGDLLSKTVESYTGMEKRQVKKVDSLRAHNRDFYKNPVVVASAGGAAVGAASASPPAQTTTVNYTDNSTVNYTQAATAAPAATPMVEAQPAVAAVNTSAPAAAPVAAASAPASAGVGSVAGIAAGVGVVGGVIGTGAVLGIKHLTKEEKEAKSAAAAAPAEDDPEAELAAALERVRKLAEED